MNLSGSRQLLPKPSCFAGMPRVPSIVNFLLIYGFFNFFGVLDVSKILYVRDSSEFSHILRGAFISEGRCDCIR